MNEFDETQAPSAFLPIVLVELSLALLLVFLSMDQSTQRTKLQDAIQQREAAVQQSTQVQGKLQKIIQDFNAAAPEEAKAVFAKYGIHYTPDATPAPAK